MTVLYLDVTDTFVRGLATGIQRVVRKVTAELLGAPAEGFHHIVPVVARGNAFLALDPAGIKRLVHPPRIEQHASPRRSAARMIAALGAHAPWLMDRLQRRRFAAAAKGIIPASLQTAMPGPGDIVLLLDAFWGGSDSLAAARACRDRGAAVVATVYDLIPVTHPFHMTPVAARLFVRRLREAIALCDGFLSISRTTAEALKDFAAPQKVRTRIAYCGSDIGAADGEEGFARPGPSSYVVIGTLEPRKGHAVVLDAFERLWLEGSTAQLTFIGRRGWGMDALQRRCRTLMARGAPFRLVEDADDANLAATMTRASAVIVASDVEGFGLPLVEALARNIPVIASDIPVFREIGSGGVQFFDVGSATALVEAVRRFERDPMPMRKAAQAFRWPTWREAAVKYASGAVAIAGEIRTDRSTVPGSHA